MEFSQSNLDLLTFKIGMTRLCIPSSLENISETQPESGFLC